MVEKIKVWVELSGGDIAKVPEWVKTEEDLEKFANEYANQNISVGYDLLDEPMDQDEFLEQVTSAYIDAEKRGFDSIVVAIDTDLTRHIILMTHQMDFNVIYGIIILMIWKLLLRSCMTKCMVM